MALLQSSKAVFVLLDGCLELLDILRTPLTKSRLRLSVALLAFFRRSVDLQTSISNRGGSESRRHAPTGLRPPLRFTGCIGCSCDAPASASASGVDSTELGVLSAIPSSSILLATAMPSSARSLSPICRYPSQRGTRRQLERCIRLALSPRRANV